ncbi:pyridoxal phosphate-dependent aminotransferase [Oscillibacter sp. MSJ-2]|uniref:Pyridoxal phosphate-dependent aminotransferase n=1 Tax=Dysosmobacter acutus TaxID=2841504 RepID=A0ABS6FF79_9FIRM|nr:MalY/PatB family protein [Dysosmobacter acutus]MBU5627969.1 pyridoxal phosphate-dependent aminotransferase [Dysosmobacter acutus]
MESYFDAMPDRKGTNCYKWDGLKSTYGDGNLMPFWIADMEFATPPQIRRAVERRLECPAYSYTFADDGYFESIVGWYLCRHGLRVEKEEILPLPGVVMGIAHALNVVTKPGDRVIVNTPVYDPFMDVIVRLGRVVADVPLVRGETRYTLDLRGIEERLKQGAKAYILCSPHNPVGRVWEREELAAVAELCQRYGAVLIADEIHSDLAFSGHTHIPVLSVSKEAEQCALLLNSPAKTFNLSSFKSGYLLTKNRELMSRLREEITKYHMGVCFLGYLSTKTAYGECAGWVDELVAYLEENARYACLYLRENLPKVQVHMPEGTFLMWLDFSRYHLPQRQLMERMAKEARLAVSDGAEYGPGGEGFIRFNIGAPRSYLRYGLEQLRTAFAF